MDMSEQLSSPLIDTSPSLFRPESSSHSKQLGKNHHLTLKQHLCLIWVRNGSIPYLVVQSKSAIEI